LTDIGPSFVEALADVEDVAREQRGDRAAGPSAAEWLKIDKSALADYLKCGVHEEVEDFFDSFILPLGPTCQSAIVRNYIVLDIVFTTARLVKEWGGEPDKVLPELNDLEAILPSVTTVQQIKEYAQPIVNRALAFRDDRANGPRQGVVQQARDYIDQHYMDSDISLHVVASGVGHSPAHFCTVFSEATGHTFKAYLTDLRIKRAKELLRTTSQRTAEISANVGYNDPHYFSLVFRKSTGLSPREFRLQAQRPRREAIAGA
jgi:two-component system response regulator YesN